MIASHTPTDLTEALRGSENLNAALKSFLKNEVQKGDPAAKFVKGLRGAATSANASALDEFIAKYHEKYEEILLAIVRYAYSAQMITISEKVIEKYADEFNDTYDLSSGEIEITDQGKFNSISKEAVALMEAEVKAAELPAPPLMLQVLVHWIFEEQVLPKVLEAV